MELPSPYYILLFVRGGGSVEITVEWFVYIMVCLLVGADVVSGGRCVVLCVVVLSQPLVKMLYCRSTVRVYQGAWCAGVGINDILGFCIFDHRCILVTAALTVIKQVFYVNCTPLQRRVLAVYSLLLPAHLKHVPL